MKIIGEKINGTRKLVGRAIAERDAGYIQNLAKKQVDGGAYWLDVNAGTFPDQEPEDLVWLVEIVQEVVDVPLCLDSANPTALRAAIQEVKRLPMINSISGESASLSGILPIVAEFGCEVIAMCMDDRGISDTSQGRMEVIHKVIGETRRAGVPDDKVYADPLTLTIATNTRAGQATFDTMRSIRDQYPQAHICCGLSNVSLGLPVRSLINRTFLVLALDAGMDTALIDPNDTQLLAAMRATDLLLGNDKHCLNYTRAFRSGLLEIPKPISG
ncbi:MAG: dihydropteroate synthase [Anaerolineaceae bacterium]|nr:dihydropteroate synthase [Anaerolineaceae bacterium]